MNKFDHSSGVHIKTSVAAVMAKQAGFEKYIDKFSNNLFATFGVMATYPLEEEG